MAERVASLRSNSAFQYLLQQAAKSAIQAWTDGKTPQDREAAHQQMMGLELINAEIERIANQGTRAAAELKAEQQT